MQVIKAESAGFCMGVSLAVRKLDEAVKALKEGQKLYTLGPIIHNPALVAEYEEKGAVCLNDYHDAESGSTVIIRAHGLPRHVEDDLAQRGLHIIDATCPKVKSAQMAIKKAVDTGLGALLLFGEKDHPEVQGLLSYADDNALVFSNMEELEKLTLNLEQKYFIAAQTTQDQEIFAQAVQWLEDRLARTLPVLNTICHATRRRQEDVIALADRVKSMVIVGGMNSGNTRRLADIARSKGVFTVHCENPDIIPLEKLSELQPVGLSAGASTPDSQIIIIENVLIKS